eukprot:GAFH01001610.1.p1 GENE.GAFH01001610.1~~GAFH01001610.1.p1  ORF type:complete len:333 (+),score=152.89 GAFH01001610.1:379-1377(+)
MITPDVLKTYILQGKPELEKKRDVTVHATGASTRPEGILYPRNQLFIDVIEQVSLLVSGKNTVLSAEVNGQVQLKVMLSGDPECIFGFNDKLFLDNHRQVAADAARKGKRDTLELDDVRFHQCVKLGRFGADRTIAFVPPDGEFTLMRYRLTDKVVRTPFRVVPVVIEHTRTRFDVRVGIGATFPESILATQVVVKIPVPPNAARAKINCIAGSARYEPEQHAIMWRIRNFAGRTSFTLTAQVQLLATVVEGKPWSKPPIALQFIIPMYTGSGLEVLFMNVTESKMHYVAERFVRYITRGGNYQIRYPDTPGAGVGAQGPARAPPPSQPVDG